ncbi:MULTISPECIES: patatin-like phospholipase family protein [unclassified Bradyrhizobium]|uniref:patatin-like phospholipase family protein n=1 Tax=unclassified Bradyrhizobium TaxID=2631580 RepID=UPI00291611DE|nr:MULTISPECIES: patatin-like phospholipase family protein [unclassified Bradyrhizobium]
MSGEIDKSAGRQKIGLALSGGGSRAIAFHLGCLRALNRLGIIDRIAIISTVSGGSVIGAYFHLHHGDFASFESRIRSVLAQGLVAPMRRKLFSMLGVKVVVTFFAVGAVALAVAAVKAVLRIVRLFAPRQLAANFERFNIRSPLHRFASRTSLLEAVLDDLLFENTSLNGLPDEPHLVINATELRTGSAFRFGTRESGSWRWGKLHRNDVSLAHAVAASAAYPLFLPAFDETHTFDKEGVLTDNRIILTDGGVYDNLGLGCLWPDRSPDVSLNVIPVDTIICCSAGYGLRQDPPSQFVVARMLSVFSTTFERAQNASIQRLHETQRSGQIKSFIFPYLGQHDRKLPNPPANLVRREEAHAYPTDFSAMPEEWIDRLSLRGEQLTLCLARAYIPHLLCEPRE